MDSQRDQGRGYIAFPVKWSERTVHGIRLQGIADIEQRKVPRHAGVRMAAGPLWPRLPSPQVSLLPLHGGR